MRMKTDKPALPVVRVRRLPAFVTAAAMSASPSLYADAASRPEDAALQLSLFAALKRAVSGE